MLRCAIVALLCAAAHAQDFTDFQVQKVAVGLIYAEGPVWSRDGYLLFSDIPSNRVLKFTPGAGEPVEFRAESNGATGNTFDAQGRLYTCESRARRVTRTDKKGHVDVLADKWQGKRLNAPNDIVVRGDGQAYFTDPAFGNQQDSRELDFYGIYHISKKGDLEVIAKPKGRPNGIALSPNGKVLYVSDSDHHALLAYDLGHAGEASNERVLVKGIEGVPDGVRVDEKGNIYVAAKSLVAYSPDGKPIGEVAMTEKPSNCAFGDADLGTLYITARTSLYRVRLGVKGSVQY
jgi:gluconolactonase